MWDTPALVHKYTQLIEFIMFIDFTQKKGNMLISLAFPRFMHQSQVIANHSATLQYCSVLAAHGAVNNMGRPNTFSRPSFSLP
jgi:hypothetical protein